MGISTSNPNLMLAVLALDAYNREFEVRVYVTGNAVGLATLGEFRLDESVDFFA